MAFLRNGVTQENIIPKMHRPPKVAATPLHFFWFFQETAKYCTPTGHILNRRVENIGVMGNKRLFVPTQGDLCKLKAVYDALSAISGDLI
ncbi:MAG TPA: hypothetical protein VNV88_01055 [Candidatus Solibacter sp.]|jgi:hypothetical protein|nr:hypothetical protein [Candidatus Solibacter sp.]